MNKEMAMKLVRKEIDTKRDFVSKAESLCEVVQKFDGKVFNKRLETALREIYPVRVEHDKTFGWVDIIGYIPDRMVQSDSVDKWGYHETGYIKDDKVYLFTCAKDVIDEDGRIIAEKMIERIQQTVDYLKESADALEEQLARIDEIEAECKKIRTMRGDFMAKTKPQIREYFSLEV